MVKNPLVSVIIATFNSEKTLPMVLRALEEQTLSKDKLEILLIDGGSKDKTFEVAKEFDCKIINNPATEPVSAKLIGYKNANGKFIVYLDHDEVIERTDSLELKLSIFKKNPEVKAVIGSGYKNPPGYSFINNYINEFGDPFSFFIYRLSKGSDFFVKQMLDRYRPVSNKKDAIVFNFKDVKNLPLIELCAAGSMVDGEYMKKTFPQTLGKKELIPHFFYLLVSNALIAISKDDPLLHYSSDNFKKYLNKIKWRIKNNIYHKDSMGESGFSGRAYYLSGFQRFKKLLFIPYSYSLIFPFIDSLNLALTRRRFLYFVHVFLCIYTSNLIIYHTFLSLIGKKKVLRSYDESKILKNS